MSASHRSTSPRGAIWRPSNARNGANVGLIEAGRLADRTPTGELGFPRVALAFPSRISIRAKQQARRRRGAFDDRDHRRRGLRWIAGLVAVLPDLSRRHPRLVVEVVSDDELIDVVGLGFDAGVRLGEMIAEDMVAVR